MRRIFFYLLLLSSLLTVSQNEKTLYRGKQTINLYGGIDLPMFNGNRFFFLQGSTASGLLGPFGFTYEVMVSDRIGLGLSFMYGRQSFEGNIPIFFTPSGTLPARTVAHFYRVRSRFNFHIYRQASTDIYCHFDLGPSITNFFQAQGNHSVSSSITTLGGRTGIGWRHFLGHYLGVHMELAVGNPAISSGISIRL